ncbi:sensor domain-containing diguanylate cyclase [Roseateles amylovorans]|uniref:diguanylate cyclase n=1 Tax=Roseateles amylovorans TaxID=2978473 RepID=A0ABY6B413_9BURK|nr:diguanylate cyclase [Roseateles amylovorans]UXH79289.1 diguanylate cyclase [Roseateles amylovorans]
MSTLPRPGEWLPELPGSLSLMALLREGTHQERLFILGGWLLTLVAAVALGLLSVRLNWSGLAIPLPSVVGMSDDPDPAGHLYLSIFPPLSLCLWWTLCFGWRWGAPPAYVATLALALDADMAPTWALIFAAANPIGLGVMALGYRAVGASRALRTRRSWMFYVPLSFVAAVLSSTGALIWTHTRQLGAGEQLPIWQGWWLGAFAQSLLIAGPLLAFTWPPLWRWLQRRPELRHPTPAGRRALGLGLLLAIVLAVQGFGLVSLGLGSLQLRLALDSRDWGQLAEAARVMLSTAWVFFWVFTLIVLFVGQFGYQALSRWLRSTEALVMQLARVNAELEQRSRTDGLSGLVNRMAAEDGLRALLRAVRRYRTPAAVLMLDIDHFKLVNDRYGHAAGDAVIRALARTLQDASREVDLPGRYGGEEFVIGLAHTDLPGALQFAERLRVRIADAQVQGPPPEGAARETGPLIRYTVSIGVAVMRAEDEGIENALRRADAALYRAKQGGRNRVETEATADAPGAETGTRND